MTYRREKVNRVNMNKGVRKLSRYGIRPRGTASPFGFWFEGYQEAVRKLGFEYSSDFAFDSDDVPCFPYNDSAYPLQVPVHVGSIGAFEKALFSREEMFTHLRGTAERAIQDCGCALLCDHPVGRIEKYEEEFIELFKSLLEIGCLCVPLSEYAEQARSFLLREFQPYTVDRSIFIEQARPGSCSFEVILPHEEGFELRDRRDAVVRTRPEQVRDEFVCPGPGFEAFLAEQEKDESLTNLTLSQWYRGLLRHQMIRARRKVRGFLRRGVRR
jgi:hypothetical protein